MTLRELLNQVGIEIDTPTREKPLAIDLTQLITEYLDCQVMGSSQEFGDPITSIDYDDIRNVWQLHE